MTRQSKVVLGVAVVAAVAAAVAWQIWPRERLSKVDALRRQAAANPGDWQIRVALSDALLDEAKKLALDLARSDEAFLAQTTADLNAIPPEDERVKIRRNRITALRKEAGEAVKQALDLDRDKPEIYLAAIRQHFSQGNYADLRVVLSKRPRSMLMSDADELAIREAAIACSLSLGDVKATAADEDWVLTRKKDSAMGLLAQARRVLTEHNGVEWVRARLDLIARAVPADNAVALALQAALLKDLGEFNKAAAALEQAVALAPDMSSRRYDLASIYQRASRPADAARQRMMLFRLRPDDPYVFVAQAEALHRVGDEKGANYHLELALGAAPNDPQVNYLVAKFLLDTTDRSIRNPTSALVRAERAAQLTNYTDAVIMRLVARAEAERGQLSAAAEKAQVALEVAIRSGKMDEAREIFRESKDYAKRASMVPQEPEEFGPMPMPGAPATEPAPILPTPGFVPKAPATGPATRPVIDPLLEGALEGAPGTLVPMTLPHTQPAPASKAGGAP